MVTRCCMFRHRPVNPTSQPMGQSQISIVASITSFLSANSRLTLDTLKKKRLLKQASGISEILLYWTIILEYVSGRHNCHPQTFHSPVEGKTHTNKSPWHCWCGSIPQTLGGPLDMATWPRRSCHRWWMVDFPASHVGLPCRADPALGWPPKSWQMGWFTIGFAMVLPCFTTLCIYNKYIYILYHIIQRGSPKSPLASPGATWSHHTCKRHAFAPFHGLTGEHKRSRPVTVIYCSHLPTAVATSVDMTRLTIDIRNSDVCELHFKHQKKYS